MRNFIVTVLLSVHLFSIGVYCGVFNNFSTDENVQLIKRVCTDSSRKNMIELKIPVNMPGVSPWAAYEKVLGQIKLKDAEYTFVRLKISRDTMSLLCFPKTKKLPELKTNIIQAKNIADVPAGKKTNNISAKRALDTQFKTSVDINVCVATTDMLNICIPSDHSSLLNPFIETAGQPPDVTC